jgi:hypothetical protein
MRKRPRQFLSPNVLGVLRRQPPHLDPQGPHHPRLQLLLFQPVPYQLLALLRRQQFPAELLDVRPFELPMHQQIGVWPQRGPYSIQTVMG